MSHEAKVLPSSEHWKVAPVASELKSKLAARVAMVPEGAESIVVLGSIRMVTVAGSVPPNPSLTWTTNESVPA